MGEGGDPARTLALLWGQHTRPGRSGLTVRGVVTAAVEIADTEGLEAATMRRVAERLGAGTMSLYTHVPGRTELVELMVDTVLGELYADVDEPARQGGWRAGMEFVAERNWQLHERHPWLLQATSGRPTLGPHALLKYEAELRPLDGAGLSDVEMDSVLTLVLTHVEGVARVRANQALAQRRTGQTEEEWWTATAPALERVLDPAAFPVATRVGQAAGEQHQAAADPAHAFRFGLDRILAGVEELMRRPAP
jgi:AcrR family transcriptional regulator